MSEESIRMTVNLFNFIYIIVDTPFLHITWGHWTIDQTTECHRKLTVTIGKHHVLFQMKFYCAEPKVAPWHWAPPRSHPSFRSLMLSLAAVLRAVIDLFGLQTTLGPFIYLSAPSTWAGSVPLSWESFFFFCISYASVLSMQILPKC